MTRPIQPGLLRDKAHDCCGGKNSEVAIDNMLSQPAAKHDQ